MRRAFGFLCLLSLSTACGSRPEASGTRSLTDADYQGKKYYFGWGMNDNGSTSMNNEVKYDVLHTHDLFTQDVGGGYVGKKLIGQREVYESSIRAGWRDITQAMTADDMYLQYSSGHGYQGGLEAGVDYGDIIDATLAMPAKEKVIFTMACYSGGLVNAFDRARSRWSDYQAQGKTLFVMASSRSWEESQRGPGTDRDEPNGPYGSAGSAFGHALWKALIGYADGAVDGAKDGVMTLDEIIDYVVEDTQNEGGHTPVYTGTYDPKLAISKVLTRGQAEALFGDSDAGRAAVEKLVDDDVLR
jgi:hypothetical protein